MKGDGYSKKPTLLNDVTENFQKLETRKPTTVEK